MKSNALTRVVVSLVVSIYGICMWIAGYITGRAEQEIASE